MGPVIPDERTIDQRTTDPRLLRWDRVVGDGEAGTDGRLEVLGAHAGSTTDLVLAGVAGALEAAEVEHFLVRRTRSGSRVGVPAGAWGRLVDVLRSLGEKAALHAAVGAKPSRWTGWARDLPPEEELDPGDAGILLYAVVTDPASGFELGRRQGCRIELWEEDGHGGLVSPQPNLRTPEVTPTDRVRPTLAPGGRATVVPPFDQRDVFEVGFPIDAVILWVDGADPDWRAARDRRRVDLGLAPADPGVEERFYADHGELRYLLRSLEQYAPWLRRLHLVTAGQRPDWLRPDHPWLRVVDHREFMDPSSLPVFSPRPITAQMHHIDGLADHFLYFNDDMILGRSIDPELFFASSGLSRFFLSKSTVPRTPTDVPHLGARQLMQRLVADRYGVHVSRTFRHTPYAMTRRTMRRLEEYFPDELQATIQHPFRSADDITPEWLHHYVGYLEGDAIPGDLSYGYYRIGRRASLDALAELQTNRRQDCFCLNDEGPEDLGVHEMEQRLADILERLLPLPSTLEVDGPDPGRPGPVT